MIIDLKNLTIREARGLIKNREVSARELLSIYQENIQKKNKEINAFLEVFDDAFSRADFLDKEISAGREVGDLAGIPIAIKDNILIKGKICSAGSKILENYRAVYDATVIKKLREAGAIFIGRTNMDEFAMGSSTENSAFGPTKNPYDTERVPGGSSGGSAAAVAMQGAMAALGSDTGGSIRLPAAFCNVVGLKPTYGAVSRYGLIAMASSLDQIGPITKDVEDTEIVFNVIKGKDKFDSTSTETKNYKSDGANDYTLGLLRYDREAVDKEINEAIDFSVSVLKDAGYKIVEISLDALEYALACYYIIQPAEVSSNMARFDGVKYGLSLSGDNLLDDYLKTRAEGFGEEVKRRIMLGTYVLSSGYYDKYYGRAQKVRMLIKKEFEKIFKDVNVIITPVSTTPPFKLGEKTDDPLKMYLSDIFTVSVNLAGLPAISIPAPISLRENLKRLPVGIQFIAPWFREDVLFNIGKKYEQLISGFSA